MLGDASDMQRRLKLALPLRWFPDSAPILEALLSGLASVWAGLYSTLNFVQLQTRIATATGLIHPLIFFNDFSSSYGPVHILTAVLSSFDTLAAPGVHATSIMRGSS